MLNRIKRADSGFSPEMQRIQKLHVQSKMGGSALQLQNFNCSLHYRAPSRMDDNIFSQGNGATTTASAYSSRRRVRRFNPPLKGSQCVHTQSQDSESVPSQLSVAATGTSVAGEEGRVHTVLSYCSETSNSQPGDGIVQVQLQRQDELACSSKGLLLDDSLLSDSRENIMSTRVDDDDTAELSSSPQQPWFEAGNPFSYPSNSDATIGYESPPVAFQPRVGVSNGELNADDCTGAAVIPRRQFKVPKLKTSAYNFSIVPKELAKTAAKRRQPPGLVCKRRPRMKTWLAPPTLTTIHKYTEALIGSSEKAGGELSVFEFRASQEQSRAAGGEDSGSHDGGGLERGDEMRSRMDVSLSTRTREEQVSVGVFEINYISA